jgi:hypothetical protein
MSETIISLVSAVWASVIQGTMPETEILKMLISKARLSSRDQIILTSSGLSARAASPQVPSHLRMSLSCRCWGMGSSQAPASPNYLR